MKLRHIFAALVAAVAFTACSEDNTIDSLPGLEVSQSYLTIPEAGGDAKVTITSAQPWQLKRIFVKVSKDKKDTTYSALPLSPAWLTVDTESGQAGSATITFHADATAGGRETTLQIGSGINTQYLQIRQGNMTATNATVADVRAGVDGKTYRVSGTVGTIYNTTYGNWYLRDATVTDAADDGLTIYGTLDKQGKEKNFASLGIETGDQITIEGPRSTYGSTIELVNVTVIKLVKSLIKLIAAPEEPVSKAGGDFTVKVAYKGNGANPSIPADAQSWLGVASVETVKGVATKTQPNPSDTALIKFHAQPNTSKARTAKVAVSSGSSTISVAITQAGAIENVTLAQFKEREKGEADYRLNVIVTRVDKYGNFYVNDYTDLSGTVEIYKPQGDLAKSVKVGDAITVTGKRDQYKQTIELSKPNVEKVVACKAVTIAEFNAQPDGDTPLLVTGKVTKIVNTRYGNVYISDGTNELYVYGFYGYGAAPKSDDTHNFVTNNKIEVGDELTLVGPKTTYRSTIEMKNGYFVSVKKK